MISVRAALAAAEFDGMSCIDEGDWIVEIRKCLE